MTAHAAPDPFVIAGTVLGSRLLLGTGGMTSPEALAKALVASGTALATVASAMPPSRITGCSSATLPW